MRTDKAKTGSTRFSRGFTLLEILAAMAVLAVVVSMVMMVFGGIYDSAERLNLGTDLHEMGNACLNRMAADLQSIHVAQYPRYRPPDINDDPEIYHIRGESRSEGGQPFGRLRFTSMAHLPFSGEAHEGIAEIVYYVQETSEGGYILRRADKLFPYPEDFEESETDPIMCEQLLKFDLLYFDAEGQEHEDWDSESDDIEFSTPRAIEISLTLGTEEFSYAFKSRIALPAYRYKEVKR